MKSQKIKQILLRVENARVICFFKKRAGGTHQLPICQTSNSCGKWSTSTNNRTICNHL